MRTVFDFHLETTAAVILRTEKNTVYRFSGTTSNQ